MNDQAPLSAIVEWHFSSASALSSKMEYSQWGMLFFIWFYCIAIEVGEKREKHLKESEWKNREKKRQRQKDKYSKLVVAADIIAVYITAVTVVSVH